MPFSPISSKRPTKGDIKEAPAFAASKACAAEKHKVTLTIVPCPLKALHALSPLTVKGTFTATFLANEARYLPSLIISGNSVAVTSALTGPLTKEQIALIVSAISSPCLAINDGLVVTPSTNPVGTRSSISLMLAVSTKNFIYLCIT